MDPQLLAAIVGLGSFLVLFVDGMLDAWRDPEPPTPPTDPPHDTRIPVPVRSR